MSKFPDNLLVEGKLNLFFNTPIIHPASPSGYYLDKAPVPKRTPQGKFACGIATVWLAAVIMLFLAGHALAANILVCVLLAQAFAVGTIDFCIPSMIYNALFLRS